MPDNVHTVLVLEDEVLLLEAITKKLELAGKKVIACTSGQQALDSLASGEKLPDVVWLDYYLKDMDGLEFMQKVKANPAWSKIPVLVVSNSASPDKVSRMMALGVNRYVLKAAHRLEELVSMTNEVVNGDTNQNPNP